MLDMARSYLTKEGEPKDISRGSCLCVGYVTGSLFKNRTE